MCLCSSALCSRDAIRKTSSSRATPVGSRLRPPRAIQRFVPSTQTTHVPRASLRVAPVASTSSATPKTAALVAMHAPRARRATPASAACAAPPAPRYVAAVVSCAVPTHLVILATAAPAVLRVARTRFAKTVRASRSSAFRAPCDAPRRPRPQNATRGASASSRLPAPQKNRAVRDSAEHESALPTRPAVRRADSERVRSAQRMDCSGTIRPATTVIHARVAAVFLRRAHRGPTPAPTSTHAWVVMRMDSLHRARRVPGAPRTATSASAMACAPSACVSPARMRRRARVPVHVRSAPPTGSRT